MCDDLEVALAMLDLIFSSPIISSCFFWPESRSTI